MFGAPHAWNTVDRYLVDLSVENKFRAWKPEYAEFDPLDGWWHEPLKEYTLAEFHEYVMEVEDLDGFAITPTICHLGFANEFVLTHTDEDRRRFKESDYDEHIFFESASGRLEARYLQSVQEAAA
jgi:hypothetical protein